MVLMRNFKNNTLVLQYIINITPNPCVSRILPPPGNLCSFLNLNWCIVPLRDSFAVLIAKERGAKIDTVIYDQRSPQDQTAISCIHV